MTARRLRLLLVALAALMTFAAPARAADLEFSPSEIALYAVEGGALDYKPFTVTNNTGNLVWIWGAYSNPCCVLTGFAQSGPGTPINAGQSITLYVRLSALVRGAFDTGIGFSTSLGYTGGPRIYGEVTKAPQVTVLPGSVALGDVTVGNTASTTVTLKNTGGSTEEVLPPATKAGTDFTFVSDMTTSATLAPGAEKQVKLTYSPQVAGALNDVVTFGTVSGNSTSRVDVSLRGIPRVPKLEVTPTPIDLGDLPVGAIAMRTVTVKNTGDAPADVQLPSVVGASYALSFTSDVLSTFQLQPGEERQVTLGFSWTDGGSQTATIEFSTADGATSAALNVSARVLQALPGFDGQSTVDFGGAVVGSTHTRTVRVSNFGNTAAVLTATVEPAPGLAGASDFSVGSTLTLQPEESVDVPFTFTPSANGDRVAVVRFTWNGSNGNDRVVRLFGKGVPSATSGMTFSASTVATPSSVPTEVTTGDFDGDGNADLAAGFAATGRVAAALGNGDGTFGALTTIATDGAQANMGLAAADADGDGRDDLAVADAAGTAVYHWTAGSFALLTGVSTTKATDVRFGDMDEDGKQDLVVLDGDAGDLTYYLGTGSSFTNAATASVNGQPREFELVDYAGVGRLGAVLSNMETDPPYVVQLVTQGDPTTLSSATMISNEFDASAAPTVVAAGHFNSDGALDLTTGTALLMGRTETYRLTKPRPVTSGAGGEAVVVADFDGDGLDDQALASSAVGKISVQRSIGGGVFADPTEYPVTVASSAAPADLATADFNGDGRPDVVAASGAEGLTVLKNDATFALRSGVGRALIDQFRSGTAPLLQLHNPSRTESLRLGGWQLRFSNGDRYTLPATFALPPRGSRVIGRPLPVVDGSDQWNILSLPVSGSLALRNGADGVALYDPAGARVDAVGMTTAPQAYREGAGLAERDLGLVGVFAREEVSGGSRDSDDNAADFVALNPNAVEGDGTVLGQPGWRYAFDPTNRNDILQSSLYDPSKSASQAPNRERDGDTLMIRRRITNCSGGLTTGVCVNADPNAPAVAVTKLFARVTELSTIGNSSAAILTVRPAKVPFDTDTYDMDFSTIVAESMGGGRGAGIGASIDLENPDTGEITLYPGESVLVEFRFSVLRGGAFRFSYAADDDVIPAKRPAQTPEVGIPADAPAQSPNAPLVIPPASAAAPEAIAGTVAPPVKPAAAQAALSTSKSAAKAKCLTKAQYKRKKATLCKSSSKTTKATGKRPSSKQTTKSTSKKGTR